MILDIPIVGAPERKTWLSGSANWSSYALSVFFEAPGKSLYTADTNFRPSVADPLILTIDLQTPKSLTGWDLEQYSTGTIYTLPEDLKILGSTTGAFAGEEVELAAFTGLASPGGGNLRAHKIPAPQSFRYYQMIITKWTIGDGYQCYLGGMALWLPPGENTIDTTAIYPAPINRIQALDWGYSVHNLTYEASAAIDRFNIALSVFVEDFGWDVEILAYPNSFLAKSNGQNNDQPWFYMVVDVSSEGAITIADAYGYWDSEAKTGSFPLYKDSRSDYNKIKVASGDERAIFWGNRDIITIASAFSIEDSYDRGFLTAGHLPHNPELLPAHTTLTAAAVAATGPTLTVGSSAGFEQGGYYCMWGADGEGRDFGVQCTEIVSATQIKVDSLPRDYGAGTFIGNYPMKAFRQSRYHCNFAQESKSGLVAMDANDYFEKDGLPGGFRDPSGPQGKDILSPLIFTCQGTNPGMVSIPPNIMRDGKTGNQLTIYLVGVKAPKDTGTATAATANTLTETGKTWAVNEHAGRYAYIAAGAGYDDKVGTFGKIASNTADTLTLDQNWGKQPAAGDTYHIADEVWQKGRSYGNTVYKCGG